MVLPDYVNITSSRIAATDKSGSFFVIVVLLCPLHAVIISPPFFSAIIWPVCVRILCCVWTRGWRLSVTSYWLYCLLLHARRFALFRDHHLPLFKALDEVNASQCKKKKGVRPFLMWITNSNSVCHAHETWQLLLNTSQLHYFLPPVSKIKVNSRQNARAGTTSLQNKLRHSYQSVISSFEVDKAPVWTLTSSAFSLCASRLSNWMHAVRACARARVSTGGLPVWVEFRPRRVAAGRAAAALRRAASRRPSPTRRRLDVSVRPLLPQDGLTPEGGGGAGSRTAGWDDALRWRDDVVHDGKRLSVD